MIRIVIAEDQQLLLGAFAALLDLEPDMEVVGRASDGAGALALVRDLAPDLLLTDIEMPGLSGIEVAEALSAENSGARVLIVTTFGRPGYLRRAMDAGVKGYLLKDEPSEVLADAIRKVASGGTAVSPALSETAWAGTRDPLTSREREILRLAETHSNKAIARLLSLSPGTVRNYLSEAIAKLGVDTRGEAARVARDNGWL